MGENIGCPKSVVFRDLYLEKKRRKLNYDTGQLLIKI